MIVNPLAQHRHHAQLIESQPSPFLRQLRSQRAEVGLAEPVNGAGKIYHIGFSGVAQNTRQARGFWLSLHGEFSRRGVIQQNKVGADLLQSGTELSSRLDAGGWKRRFVEQI